MKDLPGVDPDGRSPGGLEVAGNVEAGSMSLGGVPLVSGSAIDIFIAYSNAGTTVVSSPTMAIGTAVPLDTVVLTSSTYTLSVDKKVLTLARPGIYLAFMSALLDSGSIGSGQLGGYLNTGDPSAVLGAAGSGAAVDSGNLTGYSVLAVKVTSTSELRPVVGQSSGGDLAIDASVIVIRLGDAA